LLTLDDRLVVSVTFDSVKGYVAAAPGLPTVTALSLNGLRQQIAKTLLPEQPIITLSLDRAARLERDQRRASIKLNK
jgi:hypothetical protein